MFFRLEQWDPDEFPFTKVSIRKNVLCRCLEKVIIRSQAMETFVFVLEKLLENIETQINGVCIIEDFSGYSLGQVAAVGLHDYKQMVDMLQVIDRQIALLRSELKV